MPTPHRGPFHITDAAARMAAARLRKVQVQDGPQLDTREAAHAWLVDVCGRAVRDRDAEGRRYDDSQVWRLPAQHGSLALIVRRSTTGDLPSVVAVAERGDEPPPPAADGEKTTAAIAALDAQLVGAAAVRLDDYGDLWTLCQYAPYVAYEYAERIHLRAALSSSEADAARDASDAYLDQHLRAMAAHERAKAASAVKDTDQQRGRARGRPVARGAGLYDGAHLRDAQVAMARAAAALVAPMLDRG